MNTFRWRTAAAALTIALLPAQGVAASAPQQSPPDRIELPDGWQPEGITTNGFFLYVGSLADGAIWRARIRTGEGRVLAAGAPGRVAVGVEYDRCGNLLWVAGGDTGEVRAHDAATGELLATYAVPSTTPRFVNDLVVTRDGVYATDSVHQELLVVPLVTTATGDRDRCQHELPPASAATRITLTGDLEYTEGFNLNGIAQSRSKLLAVQSNTGLLFKINRDSGRTHEVDLDGASLTNGDGLEIDGDLLYVVRNQLNRIAVLDLADDRLSAVLEDELTSTDFDVPTTVALAQASLWAVNARFNTTPTPTTPYWITRLDEFED